MDQLEHWLKGRLSPADLSRLRRQGFVSGERLPSGSVCHKLRFRDEFGQQRVIYLGTNPAQAAQLAAWLVRQQAPRRRLAELHRLAAAAGAALRDARRRLTPCAAQCGAYSRRRAPAAAGAGQAGDN